MKHNTAFHKISSIIDSKLWGCLADTTFDADRYDKYANGKYLKLSLMEYWSARELEGFRKKLKEIFDIDVVVFKKDKMDDVARKIKNTVGNNLSRL